MLMLGKDVMDKEIVHVDNDEEQAKVKDILLNKDTAGIAYLTFEIDGPVQEADTTGSGSRAFDVANAGGIQTTPGNWGSTTERVPSVKTRKQLFLIPAEQIERITAHAVIMKGTEVEQDLGVLEDHISLAALIDQSVKTKAGEGIGKIKDIVLEEREKKVIGFKLSEGLWEKIIGDGTKYMAFDGIVDWKENQLIVESRMADQLVEGYGQLI